MMENSPNRRSPRNSNQPDSARLERSSMNSPSINSSSHVNSPGKFLKLSNMAMDSSRALPQINSSRSELHSTRQSNLQNKSFANKTFQGSDIFVSSSQIPLSQSQSLKNVFIDMKGKTELSITPGVRLVTNQAALKISNKKAQWPNGKSGIYPSPKNYILNKDQDIFGSKLFAGKLQEIIQTEEKKNSFNPSPKKYQLQEPLAIGNKTPEKAQLNSSRVNNSKKEAIQIHHYPFNHLIAQGQKYLAESKVTDSVDNQVNIFSARNQAGASKAHLSPVLVQNNFSYGKLKKNH